jgi:hypothetical protein
VFALETKDRFEIYKDLHLQKLLLDFDRDLLTFIDLGISLFNEEKQEKYSFVKMVS